MLKLTLDHKTNIGNEFLGSIMYRNIVSYITYDLLVTKLIFLLISSFFDANSLIKKSPKVFSIPSKLKNVQ